jgi:ABC-type sugar transport system substrate-binding protein
MFHLFKSRSRTIVFVNLILIALVALAALAAGGCASSAPAPAPAAPADDTAGEQDAGVKAVEEMTIGVSFPSLMSGTWQATEQHLHAYQEELGFELVQTVADNDVNKQLSQIEDMIAQDVDAIIVDPIDSKAIISAIRAANEAEIPILLFDRPPAAMDGVASFVGSDNYEFGKEAARQLKVFADENDVELKVLVLIGALTDENAVNRNDGFQEVAEELSIDIVAEVPTDWKPDKALDGVTNALQANPEINAIFIPSDYLLPSVLSALKTSDRLVPYGEEGHIMLAQIDGDGNGAKALQDGYSTVDVAHDPLAWARKPVDNAITIIQGGEVEPEFDLLPGVVGTVENIHDLGDDFWGNTFVEE